MTDLADKLHEAIGKARFLESYSPGYWYHPQQVQKMAQIIVAELGIDREVVVALIDAIPDGPSEKFKTDEENIAKASRALSALLEVAKE